MRVLHCVGRMDRGGIETFLMNVLRHEDRETFCFDFLCTFPGEGDYHEEIRRLGARIYSFDEGFYSARAPFKQLRQVSYYRRFLRENDYDVLHFHASHAFDAALQLIAARLARRRGVVIHSHNSSSPHPRLNSVFAPLLGTARIGRLACSDIAGTWLFSKHARWTLINNAIDTSAFAFDEHSRAEVRNALGIAQNAPVSLMVGRFAEQKNHAFMIDVFAKVIAERPDAILLLVGDGPSRAGFEEQVRARGLSGAIRFLGLRSDVARLLSAADYFVMPSLFEGLPVAAIEAQASGIRCFFSEALSDEVDLGLGTCEFLPIDSEGTRSWSERLVAAPTDSGGERLARAAHVDASGYGIVRTVELLNAFYRRVFEERI